MDLVFSPGCAPFSIAAAILIGLTAIEILSMLLGFSLSSVIGKPAFGHDGLGHDLSHEASFNPLAWLNVGRLPLLILLMLALGLFAAIGYGVQAVAALVLMPLPASLASAIAFVAALPAIRASSRTVARLIPTDETYAVDDEDFVGRLAEVTIGPLDQGLPGRVKVKDRHGNWHQLRARAADGTEPLGIGAAVLLVDRKAGVFLAVPGPSDLV